MFTYLAFGARSEQTEGLLKSGCIGVAYETVTAGNRTLPLLAPMSEVAGRMAVQVGAYALQKPKVAWARCWVVFGCRSGECGGTRRRRGRFECDLKWRSAWGANVSVLDRNIDRLRYLDDIFDNQIKTIFSTTGAVESAVTAADLVIGTVLIPGRTRRN